MQSATANWCDGSLTPPVSPTEWKTICPEDSICCTTAFPSTSAKAITGGFFHGGGIASVTGVATTAESAKTSWGSKVLKLSGDGCGLAKAKPVLDMSGALLCRRGFRCEGREYTSFFRL